MVPAPASKADFTRLEGKVDSLLKIASADHQALFGEEGQGGLVRDLSETKQDLNATKADVTNTKLGMYATATLLLLALVSYLGARALGWA